MDLVFVFGAESNGTRLMTRIFIENGYWGIDGHDQPSITNIPHKKKIVIRRSIPHGGDWKAFQKEWEHAFNLGYSPKVVVPIRNQQFAAKSAVKAEHTDCYEAAYYQQSRALKNLFRFLQAGDINIVTYESLITDSIEAVRHLGLTKMPKVVNENRKYYEHE